MNKREQPSGRELDKVLLRAMKFAQEARDVVGLGSVDSTITPTRGGGRWVGPKSYRVTLWLRPWEYLEVLERMRRDGHPGGITSYLLRGYRAHQRSKDAQPRQQRRKLAAVG